MAGASEKGAPEAPPTDNRDADTEAQRSAPIIGYKRRRTKEIVIRGKRPIDINSNEIIDEESGDAPDKDIADHVSKPKRRKTTPREVGGIGRPLQGCSN